MSKFRHLLLPFAVLLATSCALFPVTYEPLELVVRSKSFVIAWDQPLDANTALKDKYVAFNLYASKYAPGALIVPQSVNFIARIPYSDNPEFTVTSDILEYGKYTFAVSAVMANGSETIQHSSTDFNADPPTGWYVFWIGTE